MLGFQWYSSNSFIIEKDYKRIASSIILTLYEDEGVIVEAYKCNNSALLVKL